MHVLCRVVLSLYKLSSSPLNLTIHSRNSYNYMRFQSTTIQKSQLNKPRNKPLKVNSQAQIQQLISQIRSDFTSLKESSSSSQQGVVISLQKHVSILGKFVNYWIEYQSQRDLKENALEDKLKRVQTQLTSFICDYSILKQQHLQLYQQVREKDSEIQKLKISNRINVSYASSITYRTGSVNEENSDNDVSSTSNNISVYTSDQEGNSMRSMGMQRRGSQDLEMSFQEYEVQIRGPPQLNSNATFLTSFKEDRQADVCVLYCNRVSPPVQVNEIVLQQSLNNDCLQYSDYSKSSDQLLISENQSDISNCSNSQFKKDTKN